MLSLSACASAKRSAPPATAVSAADRLAAADADVRAGCFDCLVSAFTGYRGLQSIASVADRAAAGAARSAALLAIRERELGTEDSGYLTRAREIAAASPQVQAAVADLLDIADTLPQRGSARAVLDDVDLKRNQTAFRNRTAWTERLRTHADEDALSAYLWLAFNCSYTPTNERAVDQWLATVPLWRDTSLLAFRAATCGTSDRAALERLLSGNARFMEAHYFISLTFAFTGRIDQAMEHLLKAYDWRKRWPAVTNSLGVDYIALEEFDEAIAFFDRTLEMVPRYPDALLNKVKALTYAGRNTDAIATVDRLLGIEGWLVGDARYWRALNEAQLGRNDEAWEDIELAAKQIVNAEVPKLAGIIAYRRKERDVSRAKFEESRGRNPDDCETGFYLGIVLSEQSAWARAADVLVATVDCFQKAEATLNEEIAGIRASTQPPERQARQIRKREQQIAANRRMIATSWFNTAVSYFNLSRTDAARQFAEKVSEDEQFGERARELLARLR